MAQTKKNPPEQISVDALKEFGGDKRDRTADLLHAMQALSQLSYTPKPKNRVVLTAGIICNGEGSVNGKMTI